MGGGLNHQSPPELRCVDATFILEKSEVVRDIKSDDNSEIKEIELSESRVSEKENHHGDKAAIVLCPLGLSVYFPCEQE